MNACTMRFFYELQYFRRKTFQSLDQKLTILRRDKLPRQYLATFTGTTGLNRMPYRPIVKLDFVRHFVCFSLLTPAPPEGDLSSPF